MKAGEVYALVWVREGHAFAGIDLNGAVSVRGYGLWLVRQRPVYMEVPDKGKAVPFWLHGQSIIRQEVSTAYGGTRYANIGDYRDV